MPAVHSNSRIRKGANTRMRYNGETSRDSVRHKRTSSQNVTLMEENRYIVHHRTSKTNEHLKMSIKNFPNLSSTETSI